MAEKVTVIVRDERTTYAERHPDEYRERCETAREIAEHNERVRTSDSSSNVRDRD